MKITIKGFCLFKKDKNEKETEQWKRTVEIIVIWPYWRLAQGEIGNY